MYAIKIAEKAGIPECYAIVEDQVYKRYLAYFQSEPAGMQYSVDGKVADGGELLLALRMADKVNDKQVALISRYAGKQRDVFAGIVPVDFKVKRAKSKPTITESVPEPVVPTLTADQQFKKQGLVRVDPTLFNPGDVLYGIFVLCVNPFDEYHRVEWIKSFKSTVEVDKDGRRYVFLNDVEERGRCYEFATMSKSEDKFRLVRIDQKKNIEYKGADMR